MKCVNRCVFPLPFATQAGQYLIMPVNEGISYPVDDESLPTMSYHLAGGHGLCMGFWGCTDLTRSLMAIVETPDDAVVDVPRLNGRLCQAPEWLPQKGQFGPPRRIRYVSLDAGGYVSMCKRYRQYAQHSGLFKTLEQKRAENPHVDLLVGAVNVWCWDRPGPEMCAEMKSLGIERILWSNRSTPEQIQQTQRHGCPVEPLRHLPGPDGSGQFPQARLPAPGLDQRRLAQRHRAAAGRLVDHGLGRAGQGRGVVLVRRAVRSPWPSTMRVAEFPRNSPRTRIAVASSTRPPRRNGANATTRITR